MALSCIVCELKQDVGRKSQFYTHLHSTVMLEFRCNIPCIKTDTVGLAEGEKKFDDMFTRFDTNVTDRRTDRQTPHDSRGSAMHGVARQKNSIFRILMEKS